MASSGLDRPLEQPPGAEPVQHHAGDRVVHPGTVRVRAPAGALARSASIEVRAVLTGAVQGVRRGAGGLAEQRPGLEAGDAPCRAA